MTKLKIYLLGQPRIEYNEVPIELTRRKALALLAYLLMTRQHYNRDYLATMLWPDYDNSRARAGLRRALATLNETPVREWIEADRNSIRLIHEDTLWVDAEQFLKQLSTSQTNDLLADAVELYRGPFMSGFTLRDSSVFDEWQMMQGQILHQKYTQALRQLSDQYFSTNKIDLAATTTRHLLLLDPLDENAVCQLMRLYSIAGERAKALREYEGYTERLNNELDTEPLDEAQALYNAIKNNEPIPTGHQTTPAYGNLPTRPALVIGREEALLEITQQIAADIETATTSQRIIQGWPGIGKTTLTLMLAHDNHIRRLFPDGILWTSVGQQPNILSELTAWGLALGLEHIDQTKTPNELTSRLSAALQHRRMLLIVDDVWEVEHALSFNNGGEKCYHLFTTRLNDVANALSHRPDDIYKIPILPQRDSLRLLRTLAPRAVESYPDESLELIRDLEGLPLALQVAGRLLQAEMSMGWGIAELLVELREGAALLSAQAPADRIDVASQTIPTVAALLRSSTDRLSEQDRKHFAFLGAFAPKPATFDLEAISAVWQADNPRPTVRMLVDRGLLEPLAAGLFQMHALLVMHARSMFLT